MAKHLIGCLGSLLVLISSCKADKSEEIGPVSACSNGSYFSLEAGECRPLSGHSLLYDPLGFERMEVDNGITVPRAVNGHSPFSVFFTYDVNKTASFDVVVKRVEYGEVLGDNYTYWEKVWVEPGQGTAEVRLYPKDGKPMPSGPANNFIEGSWRSDVGFIVEVKGGDRFEDDDGDAIKLWRVAGLEIDPRAPDDPEAKELIVGDVQLASSFVSCGEISGSVPLIKSEKALKLVFGLKDPGNNWRGWGEQTVDIPRGYQGLVNFSFPARDAAGECPPSGGAVRVDPWQPEPGQYVLQMDIYDEAGEAIRFDGQLYQGVRNSLGVAIEADPAAVPVLPAVPAAAPPAPAQPQPPVSASPEATPESGPALLFRIGELKAPASLRPCAPVQVELEVLESSIDLSLTIALKQPGNNWQGWGSATRSVPAGSGPELLRFSFPAQDENGRCAPPGDRVRDDPGGAGADQYLLQLDIFDSDGKKYDNPEANDYSFVRNWTGVKVLKK